MSDLPTEILDFINLSNMREGIEEEAITKKSDDIIALARETLNIIPDGHADKKRMAKQLDSIQQVDRLMEEVFNFEEFASMITPLILRVLTEKEIRDFNEFSRTPLGKALKEKMPNLMREVLQIAKTYGNMLKGRVKSQYPDLFKLPDPPAKTEGEN